MKGSYFRQTLWWLCEGQIGVRQVWKQGDLLEGYIVVELVRGSGVALQALFSWMGGDQLENIQDVKVEYKWCYTLHIPPHFLACAFRH